MHLSTLANALWAAGFVGHTALLFVLGYRHRWKQFPVFTAWIAFETILTILLFLIFRYGSQRAYAWAYWSGDVVDFGLQVALVFEIARIVLRPTGAWLADARSRFLWISAAAVFVALALAWRTEPSAHHSLDAWEVRGNLFTSLLICELFAAILFASQRLGLMWRNHVMRLGQGLTVWALVSFTVDVAHSYYGAVLHFAGLEHARMFVYLGAEVWWIVSFWAHEPARKPLSPKLQEYLVDLHRRVQYDLASVAKAQGKEQSR